MKRQQERTPFIVRLSGGGQHVLRYGYPRERQIEYAERVSRMAESDVAQLFGDGRRNHTPIDLDHYIWGTTRLEAARLLGEYERDLADAVALEFGDLSFPVLRARVLARSPVHDAGGSEPDGFKVMTRFHGTKHDFEDGSGNAVPLI